jgi:hypothetical protein
LPRLDGGCGLRGGLCFEQHVAAVDLSVEDGSADTSSGDESAVVEDGQVLADRAGGEREALGEVRGRGWLVEGGE